MGRSMTELRRAIAPITSPVNTADALTAVPPDRPSSLPQRIEERRQQVKRVRPQ